MFAHGPAGDVQLAGDLLPAESLVQKDKNVAGSGGAKVRGYLFHQVVGADGRENLAINAQPVRLRAVVIALILKLNLEVVAFLRIQAATAAEEVLKISFALLEVPAQGLAWVFHFEEEKVQNGLLV